MNLEHLNQRLLEIASQLEQNNEWHKNLNQKLVSSPQKDGKVIDVVPETSSGLIDDLYKVTNWLESLVNNQRNIISRTEETITPTVDTPLAKAHYTSL